MSKFKRSPLDIEAIRTVTNLAEGYLRYREMLDMAAKKIRKLEVRISEYADAIERQDEASTRILNMYDKLTLSLSLLLGNDNKLSITKALNDGVDPSTVVEMMSKQIKRMTQNAIEHDIDEDINSVQQESAKITIMLDSLVGSDAVNQFLKEIRQGVFVPETTLWKQNNEG